MAFKVRYTTSDFYAINADMIFEGYPINVRSAENVEPREINAGRS